MLLLYSLVFVELEFSELRLLGILRSSHTHGVLGSSRGTEHKRSQGCWTPTLSYGLFLGCLVQSPTRLAVTCSSTPDVTCSWGLIWTNVNILASGAMNRS